VTLAFCRRTLLRPLKSLFVALRVNGNAKFPRGFQVDDDWRSARVPTEAALGPLADIA
jgi:hypothetical protein